MQWRVETLNTKVDKELERLEPALLSKFLHIAEMLETYGPHQVREPYVKYLGDKLWEIRMKGKGGIARAIYVTIKERRIVVLHAFIKKTKKTPQSAIKLALKRLKELSE